MKIKENSNPNPISKFWGILTNPQNAGSRSAYQRSKVLSGLMLFFIIIGLIYETQRRISGLATGIDITTIMLLVLGITYYLNRFQGQVFYASILTIVMLLAGTFASAINAYRSGSDDLIVLYYLIAVIIMGDFFLPFNVFVILELIILAGVFVLSLLLPSTPSLFSFFVIFCGLLTIFVRNRRSIVADEINLEGEVRREKSLLVDEKRRSAHLGLLEEVGRQIADSFDQTEILQRSINAVINRFGYAEAAISLLTPENKLEVAAIGGTEDFGYRPGYQQEFGKGIIGYTAKIRKTYIADNVAEDPHYYSIDKHYGSAASIPIINDKRLFGVLYVESIKPNAFDTTDAQTLETLANQISASIQRAALYNQAQESLKFMSAVQAVMKAVASSLDLTVIFETVVNELQRSFGYSHISIYKLNGEFLELGAQVGYPGESAIHKIHISQGVSGRAVKTKAIQFIRDASQDPSFLRADPTVSSEICVPLLKDDMVLGMFNVEGDADNPLGNDDLNLLATLAAPIALAVDNARLHDKVKEMAMTDAVTGLSSRHAFEHILTTEIERSSRLNLYLSLIIFDLDSFKEYNDAWGHPAGDMRLKSTASLIRANLRKYDIAARYGGDEFAIIMPNTNKEGALELANRLQDAARESTKESHSKDKVISGYTLSMGLATFPEDGNTFDSILFSADQAELIAKRTGKNRIITAGKTSEHAAD